MAEKVLIVDDDVQSLKLVGLMLERQGYKIVAANNGAQGLRAARTETPDVILMDVMMPDMDGYEVTRRLRHSPETAGIPILMFTARGQAEDKITGYGAGADDYLTKPIHPAELAAHLRALLDKTKDRGSAAAVVTPAPRTGYTIGFIAAKGGLGVSTLALNFGIAFHQKTGSEVIAAELRPGQGTWQGELSLQQTGGLGSLLRARTAEITPAAVENELTLIPYGIRLLLAPSLSRDTELMKQTEQLEAVVATLPKLAKVVLLDIGTNYLPGCEQVLEHCNEVFLITEPLPTTLRRTQMLLEELTRKGFGKSKVLTVINMNRTRSDMQLSAVQMQEMLQVPIAYAIPPVPELAFQAASRGLPISQVQAGSILSKQFQHLANKLAERVPA